jgi:hypothetical protein
MRRGDAARPRRPARLGRRRRARSAPREADRPCAIVGEEVERSSRGTARQAHRSCRSSTSGGGDPPASSTVRRSMSSLDPVQRAAVEAVTKASSRKLLHQPSVRLKEDAGTRRASATPPPCGTCSTCRDARRTRGRPEHHRADGDRGSPRRTQAEHVAASSRRARRCRRSSSSSDTTGDRRQDVRCTRSAVKACS